MHDISIIGGGISGLSTANFLSKKTSDFLILEASDKVGGTINSSKVDGYILENGPNTVLDNNKEKKLGSPVHNF